MGAEQTQTEKDPAVERAETRMREIQADLRDDIIVLSAKKAKAERLLAETTTERDKALDSGDAKALKKVDDWNKEIEALKQRIEELGRKITERREKAGEQRAKVADRLGDRAVRLEGRDSQLDAEQAELPQLKADVARLRGECKNLMDKETRTPEEQGILDSKLKELQEKQARIERIEGKNDRAERAEKRAAVLKAEADQIRSDSARADKMIANLEAGEEVDVSSPEATGTTPEATSDDTPKAPTEAQEGRENLVDSMTQISERMALSIADNPPEPGDLADKMQMQTKQVLLMITMAMSPKPLRWNAKSFDTGRREILEKVAGLKLTDLSDGGMQVENVDPDPAYKAPAGPTQKLLRQYFGEEWWENLNGLKDGTEDEDGTTLADFEADIPNPTVKKEDQDKRAFADALKTAGADAHTQILPWLKENAGKVTAGTYKSEEPSSSLEAEVEADYALQFYTNAEPLIQKTKWNSETDTQTVFIATSGLTVDLEALESTTPTEMDSSTGGTIIQIAKNLAQLSGETWYEDKGPALSFVKEIMKKPFIELVQESANSDKSEVKDQAQKVLAALQANDPQAPAATPAS